MYCTWPQVKGELQSSAHDILVLETRVRAEEIGRADKVARKANV